MRKESAAKKGITSLDFMVSFVIFFLIFAISFETIKNLGFQSEFRNGRLITYARSKECGIIIDAHTSNPEIKADANIECAIFENMVGLDFNGSFLYVPIFSRAEIVVKEQGSEVKVNASHYR
ncbi:MAG: hypothetical protein QXM75_01685 [Candidatus Diapherotrites archaeon]